MEQTAIVIPDVAPTARELRPVTMFWRTYSTFHAASWWIAIVGSGIAALLAAGPDGRGYWQGTSIVLIVTVAGAYVAGLLWTRYVQRLLKRLPSQQGPFTWTIDVSGLAIDNGPTAQRIGWAAILDVGEEKDRMIFAVSPSQNFVLPKRCLSDAQMRALRDLILAAKRDGHLAGVD